MTTGAPTTDKPATGHGKALHISLWIGQILLAVMFGMAGLMKTTKPIADLGAMLPWTRDVPEALVRFIGIAELLGALGVVLPAATRVRPALTPLAAAGLFVVMLLAFAFHVSRGEAAQALPINLVLGGLAAFVAWGRFKKSPISPRA
jgi:putative oxidoreductase